MNILLVNPPIRLTDKPRHIPHGLAILAAIIRKNFKHSIRFVDWNAHRYSEEQFKQQVQIAECDIALIGGLIPAYKYLIKIADIIKQYHPECLVVAGGSAAMSVPELLLHNSTVDLICTGEGEITIQKLLTAFEKTKKPDLANIPGIAYKDQQKKIVVNQPEPLVSNLDLESELPAYDLLPMDIYLANPVVGLGKDIDFISGRGCPFQCTFCYQPWGHKNRTHSISFLKNAILHLINSYGINFVSFQDDLFIANPKRVIEFCETRNRYFPEIYWSCTGRANICNDELMKIMRNSGCTLVSYGFESGSPRMLASMNKQISLVQMENVLALNRKYDFPVPVSFILGMPGETVESCDETVSFCLKNNITLDSLMYATPYPGTPLFQFALKTGRIKKDAIHDFLLRLGDARDFVVNLTDSFSDNELQEKYLTMINITRDHYCPIPKDAMENKIRSLFGPLSELYFSLPPEDREHRSKHGALSLF